MFPIRMAAMIDDLNDVGSLGVEDGRCWFVAPFNARVSKVFMNPVTDAGSDQILSISTSDEPTYAALGTVSGTVGNGNVTEFEVPPGIAQSYVRAGQAFSIAGNGAGGIPSKGGVVVELYPA